jgi:hypothetical protein
VLALYTWWFACSPLVREHFYGEATGRRLTAVQLAGKSALSLAVLLALLVILSLLSDGSYPLIEPGVAWALVALTYVPFVAYLWMPTERRESAHDWFSREWRLVPFYVAAALVSLAALRYIFSD